MKCFRFTEAEANKSALLIQLSVLKKGKKGFGVEAETILSLLIFFFHPITIWILDVHLVMRRVNF